MEMVQELKKNNEVVREDYLILPIHDTDFEVISTSKYGEQKKIR